MTRLATLLWLCTSAAFATACRVGYDVPTVDDAADVEGADVHGDLTVSDVADASDASTDTMGDAEDALDAGRDVLVDAPRDAPLDAIDVASEPQVDVVEETAPDVRDVQDVTVDASSICASGACRRVFVTSTTVPSGAIGGLAAADALCQSAATGQHLGGTWKAFLAGTSTSAASRVTQATVPYELLDGTVIATNWTTLMAGHVTHAIDIYETGATRAPTDTVGVWTGANSNGTPTTSACADWTDGTSATQGGSGDDSTTGGGWSTRGPNACNVLNRLYCLEQ